MTKTKCAHCNAEFESWIEYAKHILEKHPWDKMRADWARSCLANPALEVPSKTVLERLLNRLRRHPVK